MARQSLALLQPSARSSIRPLKVEALRIQPEYRHRVRSQTRPLPAKTTIRGTCLEENPNSVDGGPGGIRTLDLLHAMEARSQLRHRPTH